MGEHTFASVVVVVTDEVEDGPFILKDVIVDGHRWYLPAGTTVRVEVGSEDAGSLTFTLMPKSVRFESESMLVGAT